MLEKCELGQIIKNRISELGYTQGAFADKIGISLESLKNYIYGNSFYTVEVLDMLAKGLDCSYDYLLGKSKATKNENHLLVEELGLSEQAIESIKAIKDNKEPYISENCFKVLDNVICNHDLILYMTLYIMADKGYTLFSKEIMESLMNVSLDGFNLDLMKSFSLSCVSAILGEMRRKEDDKFEINDEMKEMLDTGKE